MCLAKWRSRTLLPSSRCIGVVGGSTGQSVKERTTRRWTTLTWSFPIKGGAEAEASSWREREGVRICFEFKVRLKKEREKMRGDDVNRQRQGRNW